MTKGTNQNHNVMSNVLVKKTLLLAFMLSMMSLASAQSISYKSSFDLSSGITSEGTVSVAAEEKSPFGLAMSSDGMKLFIIGTQTDGINQYSLTAPFDITSGLTHDGSVAAGGINPLDLVFNNDGSKLFIMNNFSDAVLQYSLSVNFDVTSALTYDGAYSLSAIETGGTSLGFNSDGSVLYVAGINTNKIHSISLSNPFDIVSGTVTYQGASDSFTGVNDFDFNQDGSLLVVYTGSQFETYELSSPFDIESDMDLKSPVQELNSQQRFFFAPDGNSLFTTTTFDFVTQYTTHIPTLNEAAKNDGSVSDVIRGFILEGETFTNPSGTLTYNTDYQISNLPAGLIPVLEIGDDGSYGIMSFTGTATDNSNSDDVADLVFTFSNSAFVGGDASAVTNAVSANSGISLDFRSNYAPILSYGDQGESITGIESTTFSVAGQETNPTGFAVNDDGTKLYVTGSISDAVHEYDLAIPYTITSGVTYSGNSYSVSTEDGFPLSVDFNDDGTSMFVVGGSSNTIYQYSLSVGFDLSSTVALEGSYSVANETTSEEAIAFAPDGMTMYVIGFYVYVYELTDPFDITSGVTYEYTYTPSTIISDLDFSKNGKTAYISGSGAGTYSLDFPYYLENGVERIESGGSLGNEQIFSPDGSIVLGLNTTGDEIRQENLLVRPLQESYVNDGSIVGEYPIYLSEDSFVNAGGTLSNGTHFSIAGLPAGLTPVIEVSNDGVSGLLKFNDGATSHDITDNVSDLVITFTDAAFVNSTAADVVNAINTNTYLDLEFREVQPLIYAGEGYTTTGLSYSGNSFNFLAENATISFPKFSNDGLKFYVIDRTDNEINQYTLSQPYDLSSASHDGVYDATALDASLSSFAFNLDGTKVYISGTASDLVHQFSLTTPYDLLGTMTSEGSHLLMYENGLSTGINPQDLYFAPDGKRLFASGNLQDAIYQYVLATPFDINSIYLQESFSVTSQEGNNIPGIEFAPDGLTLMVFGSSTDRIYNYSLTEPFDISNATYSGDSYSLGAHEAGPYGFTFTSLGEKMFTVGTAGDAAYEYGYSNPGFVEVAANDGSVSGSFEFRVSGSQFANAGGTLPGSAFNATGAPAGLTPEITISADGTTATLSFSGNATNHQDADDTDGLTIELLDAAFIGSTAASVTNSSLALSVTFDFADNGTITYTPATFSESYLNDGSVNGEMQLSITIDPFSNSGGTLTETTDYTIAGIPDGLTPVLSVAANGLSATLTFSGNATNHQNINDVSDLIFTFENSAFASTEAQYVFNSTGVGSGTSIDFEDNNPSITYGNQFDLSDNPDYLPNVTYDFSAQEDSPGGMAFSNDGLKMFIVGYTNDAVFEYNLATAFDISDVTYSGNSYATGVNSPGDLVFDTDGTKMFIMDGSGDEVEQYTLSTAFDLSSTIINDGAFKVNTEDIQPSGITFSPDGKKMYMIGSSNDKIYQYTLTVPFDITTGISYDGVEAAVSGLNYSDIQISEDGKNIFLTNSSFPSSAYIRQYILTTPFDISDGITNAGGFYFRDINHGPTDLAVSPDRKRLIVLADLVYQFDLNLDGFVEVGSNNGEVEGSLHIEIKDETFSNAGSTLVYGSDYTIDNLPAGLSASMDIAVDGYSATVSLSGVANNHQDVDDVELEFTFNNSAFVNSNAADVQNAIGASSTRVIDFRNNNPALSYGNTLDMDFATQSGTLDVSSYSDYTSGIVFSNDGMKMFISVYGLGIVYEYDLTSAYDVTGATEVASYDHSMEDIYAEDLAFSSDGMKMFVLGNDSYSVYQYNLTTPFSIGAGVTYSGNSFSHEDYDLSIYAMALNPDGTKLYLGSGNEGAIMQFSLGSPFDLSSVTFDQEQLDLTDASPTGMVFSSDGRYLLLTDDNTYQTIRYRLNSPYDMGAGGVIEETFDLDVLSVWGSGISASPDGSKVFIADGDAYQILQYTIDLGDFTETIANDGTVEGSTNIYLVDDTFVNAGGMLSHGADYIINNLPSGLTPTLTVAGDGYSASLSLSGSTSDHGDADDISSLQFTFNNSAFTTYDAVDVTNSTSYDAGFGIDFSPYTGNEITSFTFPEIDGSATIDNGAHSITAEATAGTDISAITPTIGVSQNASIAPNTGTEQDFTSTVIYSVTAEDGTPQDWDVTITEALATPTDIILSSASINENGGINDVVGDLSSVDASFSDSHAYTLIAGTDDEDNASFNVNGSELRASESFDFETKSSYNIRIQTNDNNGGLFEKAFVITIDDVNEVPTDIALDNNSIDESNPTGTAIGSLTTADEDQGQSYTYTLVSGTGDTDNASFNISGSELVSAEVFDFESKNSYSVRIQTNDGNGGTYAEAFTVTINDLPASITSVALDNSSVDENEASGTLVGSLSTFGEDLSGSYTYAFTSGTGDNDNGSFSISGDQLLTSASFDFEVKSNYSVRIMTDDGNLSESFAIAIVINDVNEAPTDILLSSSDIVENNAIGEVIGTFTTTDEDNGQSFTYSLVGGTGDADNASFNISGDQLQANAVFDFETKSSYSIRVETNDGNGGSYQEAFTISITDENESILVSNPIADLNLDETFGSTTVDLTDVFTDLDGDALSYSVQSSNTSVATVSNSGVTLTITEAGIGTATITVTADDGSGVTTSDEFSVTVNDINFAPVVANSFPDGFTAEEGFGTTQVNYTDVFSDPDGDNLTISVTSSNEDVVTTSVIANNQIQITEVGVGESTITVTADDGNGGSVSDTFTFTVTEAPLGFEDNVSLEVYPNPTTDFVNIRSTKELVIQITDLRGQSLRSGEGQNVRMDIRELRTGVYILKISDGESTTYKRIIKAN